MYCLGVSIHNNPCPSERMKGTPIFRYPHHKIPALVITYTFYLWNGHRADCHTVSVILTFRKSCRVRVAVFWFHIRTNCTASHSGRSQCEYCWCVKNVAFHNVLQNTPLAQAVFAQNTLPCSKQFWRHINYAKFITLWWRWTVPQVSSTDAEPLLLPFVPV